MQCFFFLFLNVLLCFSSSLFEYIIAWSSNVNVQNIVASLCKGFHFLRHWTCSLLSWIWPISASQWIYFIIIDGAEKVNHWIPPSARYDNSDEVVWNWASIDTLYLADKIEFLSQDKLPESHDESQEKSGYGLLTIARSPWQ